MNKPIHRILALLPMLALGISAMMYFFFEIAQFQDKITAHETILAQKGLSTIKMPLKDFNTQAQNDEVWYGGQLYDISSYSIEHDSVCVVIFHDEQEESLIKGIAAGFDPYDKYISDKVEHIVKHRIQVPDDSKILVTPYSLKLAAVINTIHTLPYFINYFSPVYPTILKPPPDLA